MSIAIFRQILFGVLGCCLVSNGVEAQPPAFETTWAYSTSIESPASPAPIYVDQDSPRLGFFGMLKRLFERVQALHRPKPSEQPSSPVATAPTPTPVTPDSTPLPAPSTPPPPSPAAPAPDPPAAPVAPVTTQTEGTLTFAALEGGPNPTIQILTITNTASGPVTWTVNDNVSWLTMTPTSGTTTTETDVIAISADITGLTSQAYTAVITVATQGMTAAPQQIPVTLVVSPVTPTIGQTPASLMFIGTEGGSNPAAQTVSITNPGNGTLSWTASESAPWLSITPNSGESTTETDKITVSVNTSGLSVNTYTTTITLSDPAASNNAQHIPVTLALTAPQSGTALLTWAANTEPDLAGYRLYIGTSSGSYSAPTDVGNTTLHKVIGLLPGKTYYFAVSAYNTSGQESDHSNEVAKNIP